ncbi:helix-turn-helix domain-containing protein [Paenibacillus athensensis]|uniref:DNA-binding protein n=1 Tax=Paenibacillus athensensis TaxID=1967502 RepID=A0A4Y8Q6D7_9BACL|nr:helix-turn-helix domain-containing protein [Paenibacillus athensensis]MCD1259748.1 helix-turn-helix domain-containing protein [Paenibacillus athensensis]
MFENYDDVISVDDMCEILAIGRNKAYELLQTGQIKSFKLGKAYRIPKMCIQEFVIASAKMKIEQFSQN